MLGQEELVLPSLEPQEQTPEETSEETLLRELQDKVELARQARELSSQALFKELVSEGYLGKHRSSVKERLLVAIEGDDKQSETVFRAELKAIRSFEDYLENIYIEGNSAAEYIKQYEELKEQADHADQ